MANTHLGIVNLVRDLEMLCIACNKLEFFFVYYPDNATYYPNQRNRKCSTIDIALSNTTLNIW